MKIFDKKDQYGIIDERVAARNGMKEGQIVSTERLKDLVKQSYFEQAKDSALDNLKRLTKVQFIEFYDLILQRLIASDNRWRLGQTIFNYGAELYPSIFEPIRATRLDTFHCNEHIIPLFDVILNEEAQKWWKETILFKELSTTDKWYFKN